jgi:hypothetical protein
MRRLHGELVAMQEWVKASAPWYVAVTDDKQRGRLNLISHLLSQVPFKPLGQREVTLPSASRPAAMWSQTSRCTTSPRRSEPKAAPRGQGGSPANRRDVLEEDAERRRGSDHGQLPDPESPGSGNSETGLIHRSNWSHGVGHRGRRGEPSSARRQVPWELCLLPPSRRATQYRAPMSAA